ncbi:MAG: DUF6446 family protein [Paracoccaceae bacterium]
MSGRIVGIFIMVAALAAGAALYYLQIYGFYQEVADTDAPEIQLVNLATGTPEPILYDNFQAIDAESSPIRYRACFTTSHGHPMLTETYELLEDIDPRNAPGWFDCFNAEAIAADLDSGAALLFLGQKNVHFGVDRVVAIHEDGRGWVWHELNDCGEKAYDGTVVGEECPARPKTTE